MPLPLATEPRDLLLDPETNDIVVTSDLQFSRGADAIAQACRIVLQMFAGEWFLDLGAGIKYWENILGAKPELAAAIARTEFRRELLAVTGVVSISRLDVTFDRKTRTMTIVWQVLTIFGETPVDTIQLAIGGE